MPFRHPCWRGCVFICILKLPNYKHSVDMGRQFSFHCVVCGSFRGSVCLLTSHLYMKISLSWYALEFLWTSAKKSGCYFRFWKSAPYFNNFFIGGCTVAFVSRFYVLPVFTEYGLSTQHSSSAPGDKEWQRSLLPLGSWHWCNAINSHLLPSPKPCNHGFVLCHCHFDILRVLFKWCPSFWFQSLVYVCCPSSVYLF